MKIDKHIAEQVVTTMTSRSINDALKYKLVSDLIPTIIGDASARVKLVERMQDEALKTIAGLQDKFEWWIKSTKELCDANKGLRTESSSCGD
jgi:dihydroneopterin aldolase